MDIRVKVLPKSFMHRFTNKEDLNILIFIIKNFFSLIKLKRSSVSFIGESIWNIPYISSIKILSMKCEDLYLLNLMPHLKKIDLWDLIYNENSNINIYHNSIQHLSIDTDSAIEIGSLNLFLPNCHTLYLSMIWLDNTNLEFDKNNLPKIKKLNIHDTNIVEFNIQNNNLLKDLYLTNNEYLKEISIEAINLKTLSFKYIAKKIIFKPVNLENLKEVICNDDLVIQNPEGYQFLKKFNSVLNQSSSLTEKLFLA